MNDDTVYLAIDTAAEGYILGIFSTHEYAEMFVQEYDSPFVEIQAYTVDFRVEAEKSATDAA